MQHNDHTGQTSQVLWILAQGDDGLRCGFEKDVVKASGISQYNGVKLGRDGEHDMEVRYRQQITGQFIDPPGFF
jgi:hypothetical protein